MKISLLYAAIQLVLTEGLLNMEGCGVNNSCWFQPPGCEHDSLTRCVSSVMWRTVDDGLEFRIHASILDLEPNSAYWIAVGISKDKWMGDDSVIECIVNREGKGKSLLSFNDETQNHQLLQASEVMLSQATSIVEDGHFTCNVKWLLDKRHEINENEQFKVFDLESQEWILLFARGVADIRSLEKRIHSVNDGAQFPWISQETVNFCRKNCTEELHITINSMKQTDISRYWRYRFAVIHGILSTTAWIVLGSSAILLARFFKSVWPNKKLLGTAVWFQLHRDFWIASVAFQILAVFLVIYQAGRLYECSYDCSSDDWSKKMHVITGIAATALAIFQPLLAFLRPGPNSRRRVIFNWLHWFIGMSAWAFAMTTIVLSVPMGKTGLQRVFGHAPTWMIAGYILFFFMCTVTLEILSSTSLGRADKISSSVMALSIINGPTSESPLSKPTFATIRIMIFGLHMAAAILVALAMSVMLLYILWSHSP